MTETVPTSRGMTLHIPFDNTYARLPGRFFRAVRPVAVRAPRLIRFNAGLAAELGIAPGAPEDLAQAFSGNRLPDGATPLAQAYAGHQFGGFSPQLGDGRAVLLGEVVDRAGRRRDIQLKGSGQTPFSRMGDGRAWLGPVLREYVVSEAMHAMGIPTTRALAAVTTGEPVHRQDGARPGAVLTRVAASHIRVGTFQFFAARQDTDALRRLLDYSIARHYPEVEGPVEFLQAVIDAQARLVAQWMAVGFIHGVMNTDNTAVSGETIDYGPCAFLDVYDPVTVFSSIDTRGRYAYDNQRHVIVWNMAQLASCLVPLMPGEAEAVERFTAMMHDMGARIEAEWLTLFGAKIGLRDATPEDRPLIGDLLEMMQASRADFTNTFRGLGSGAARAQFTDRAAFDTWTARWRDRLGSETGVEARMRAANPAVIPRNHRIEQMIEAAVAGDFAPFGAMLDAVSAPFEDRPEGCALTMPPLPHEVVQATYCGT